MFVVQGFTGAKARIRRPVQTAPTLAAEARGACCCEDIANIASVLDPVLEALLSHASR